MLVQKKFLVSIDQINDIKDYENVGVTTFLLPLRDYAIGFNNYFTIDDINKVKNAYVFINRILTSKDIDNLKEIIPKLECKGIIFQDIGLINIIKDREKILYLNHFNSNILTINEWLNYVDSVFIAAELSYDEYLYIANNVKKDVIFFTYGYNMIMYSRRYLISSYYDNFNINGPKDINIDGLDNKFSLHLKENEYGTVGYTPKIFNGQRLLNLPHTLYNYINTVDIPKEKIIKFIQGNSDDSDCGFLDTKTIYKIKGEK